jgi:hypothetical protein
VFSIRNTAVRVTLEFALCCPGPARPAGAVPGAVRFIFRVLQGCDRYKHLFFNPGAYMPVARYSSSKYTVAKAISTAGMDTLGLGFKV